jgi:Acetyltransferase (GNAT) domain
MTSISTPHLRIYWSINDLAPNWDSAQVPQDIFLDRSYMAALEGNAPDGMGFVYVVFEQNSKAVGRAYFQIKHFDASEHIKNGDTEEKEICFFTALSKWVRRFVSRRVKTDILICGNLLVTGEHHFQFDAAHVSPEASYQLLERAIEEIARTSPRKLSPFVLVKDIALERETICSAFRETYTEFQIQPNLILDLTWPDYESYLKAMSTRYRTREKRARKKLADLQLRELDYAELKSRKSEIHALYEAVATNVGFNMVDLNPDYLVELKAALPDIYSVFGYYQADKLVAFYTLIQNGHELDAHFIGFDRAMNHEHQLYLNMLYDMVKFGLNHGSKRIIFARTAPEIKSTVGAVPEQLNCYLKNSSTITKMVVPHIVEYLKPVEVWVQRHPFKEGSDEGET